MTFIAYLPVLSNGYIWDDDYYVTENAALRDGPGLANIWLRSGTTPQWYPVTFTTFWLEYHAWGLTPAGYHLVNVALHALSAILWWVLLRRLGLPAIAAWLAAAMFAVHPMQVESVAWISERKNVLSGVFYLAAALSYLKFDERRDSRWYATAALLFVFALLSKSVAATLPAAILLTIWWKRGRLTWRDIRPTLPLLLVGAAMGAMTLHMEATNVRATGPEWAFSWADRLLIAGQALFFYARKLAWPDNLTFIYPRWTIDDHAWAQYLFPLAALSVIALLWALRKNIGRGPLAATLFFCGTLTPALGFFNIFPMRYSFVADHFQYMAGMGLFVLVSAAAAKHRISARAMVILLPALVVATWHQAHMYHDMKTLWQTTVERNPDAWMAHNNLGVIYNEEGQFEKAVASYKAAIRLKPDHADAMRNMADSLLRLNQPRLAIDQLNDSLALNPDNPSTYAALGEAYLNLRDPARAQPYLEKAIVMRPRDHDVLFLSLYNLGKAQMDQGRPAEAQNAFDAAAALRPKSATTAHGQALSLDIQGKPAEAAEAYERALRLDPNLVKAHHDYALMLARHGHTEDSIEHFRAAIRIDPQHASSYANMGTLMQVQGKTREAIDLWEKAIEIEPDRHGTLRSLAWVYATDPDATIRNGSRAVAMAKRANELIGGRDSLTLDALAAAYAETGDYFQAIAAAELAQSRAEDLGRAAVAAEVGRRLDLYRQSRAYRDSRR